MKNWQENRTYGVTSYSGPAKKFLPHQFGNSVELTVGLPKILLTRDAYEDMFCLVDEVGKEVGWVGSVEKKGRDYLIKEIFLLDQESHSTTCEITANGLAEFATEILSSREDGMEVVNSLRFWGHSHCNMGTSPSGQDNSQMTVFAESCEDFFIRGILNKNGRMEFTLYLYNIGVEIHDLTWELYEPTDESRRQKWQAEIEEKVREKYIPLVNQFGVGGYAGRYWGDNEPFPLVESKVAVVGAGSSRKKAR